MKFTSPLMGRKRPAESRRSWLNPPQSIIFICHLLFALTLLLLTAKTPASRLMVLLSTTVMETFARSSKGELLLYRKKLPMYVGFFATQYFIVEKVNLFTTQREVEIRGIPVPLKGKTSKRIWLTLS